MSLGSNAVTAMRSESSMSLRPTDDEIIAHGDIWNGIILELRTRMADFAVDGKRFGSLLPETISGSSHDRRLTKRSEEIVTAAFILGRLGYENVQIFTRSSNGMSLERPDLDVRFENGETIGIEISQVSSTNRLKHDAQIAVLEHSIRDLIDRDQSFAEAFGPYNLTLSQSSVLAERDIGSKKQGQEILSEAIAFIRAKGHHYDPTTGDKSDGWFGPEYPTLYSRGATYYSTSAIYGPYFSVIDGGTVTPAPETAEVIRVLDRHRRQAITYRTTRTWMMMYLPDSNELFRNTVGATERLKPDIAPFAQCHITDASWRLASLA